MMPRMIMLLSAAIAFLALPAHAGVPGSGSRQFRLHRQHPLADGSIVAFTDLSANMRMDSQSGAFQGDKTLLLDGAQFGRWIITIHESASSRQMLDEQSYDFTLTSTGEHLRITRQHGNAAGTTSYCVTFGNQSADAAASQGPNRTGEFVSPIKGKASEAFKKGLHFIWSLSLTTEPFDWLSPAFSVIWGQPPAQGTVPSVPYEIVPVDCSFDASFGYPCAPQERPARADGRIYVQPTR